MKPLSVVIAQPSGQRRESLAQALTHHFRVVNSVDSVQALRLAITRNRADVAVVDLELSTLPDVVQLRQEFPSTKLVCTHRLADEKMWAQALSAGAAGCCYDSDVRAIVLAASTPQPIAHAHAA